ncbi:hypothetical protein GQ600_1798 [Phytophthora cactorum]|nr:hypothetical protein GQ600_1798 [Phytophthora cactorum]
MFHYFHDKTDEHVARIAELEKALEEAQEKEKLVETSREMLEIEQQERASELSKAQQEVAIVKEEATTSTAFAQAKRELEAHTRALETKLDAQRAAFQIQMQDLEPGASGRMQAAKAELMLRTNDQVASTTHRTLLENEHFTHELAFQSRETENCLSGLMKSAGSGEAAGSE